MKNLPYTEHPIRTIDSPTKEQFTQLVYSAEEPFKVCNSLTHWSLYQNIANHDNPIDKCDYLVSLAKKKKVSYTILKQQQKGNLGLNERLEENFSFNSRKKIFPEFIEDVKRYIKTPSLGTLYLQSTPINEFNSQISPLPLFDNFFPTTMPRFWIGSGNQFVSLHNDPYRNIIALFSGKKRVILFPPEELPNLYPAPFDKKIGGVIASLTNIFKPDLAQFPLLEVALKRVKVAYIEPGEFLYIPPLWWHAVEGQGFNIGLNCWFFDDENGKNQLSKLYIPLESLMIHLNQANPSLEEKSILYKCFKESIVDVNYSLKTTNQLEALVLSEAQRISSMLDQSKIKQNQKDLWRKWIITFAYHYAFCLSGTPFPSLPEDAFQSMINRMDNKPLRLSLETRLKKLNSHLRLFLIKKSRKHGIVPH